MPDRLAPAAARIKLEGLGLEVELRKGESLLGALRRAGLAVDSDCGGRGTCGKCRVRFLEGAPASTAEDEFLISSSDVAAGWRLACQAHPDGLCRVLIPQTSPAARGRKMRILTEATAAPSRPARTRTRLSGFGAAIDVGTTTVVCYLMDLAQSLQVGVVSFPNPQAAFGPDVISRITYAHRGSKQLRELQKRIVVAVDRNLAALCKEHEIDVDSVATMTVAGNMTMLHLFRGIDPWPLGVAPYEPVFVESPSLNGDELGFRRFAKSLVHVLPGVGGHLGSDITAGVVALGLPRRRGLSLFMDLGTNGEVVLCSNKLGAGASCAAGPAFEGVHINSGMMAMPGAIERVDQEDGRLQLDTIDGAAPVGLCGSGLIDALALLLKHRLLPPSGRLVSPGRVPEDVPDDLRRRVHEDERGRFFFLHEGGERGDIIITQQDVREVQLAKAPIRASIEMLLKDTGRRAEEIQNVFVAGAFGSSIRGESLLSLGVVPPGVNGRIHAVGNTAGLGARLALTSPQHYDDISRLSRAMEHVELVMREDFRQAFAAAIPFPAPTETQDLAAR